MAGFNEKPSDDALNGPDGVNGSEDDSQIEDYTIPIPKDMTLDDKKEHLKQIVGNFIKLSTVTKNGAAGASLDGDEKTLSRIAITKWSKDSWVLILARLATRGLSATPELANLVREELLKFLEVDIKNKIGYVIEWLNEEYYHEKITYEHRQKESPDSPELSHDEQHKTYLHYASVILNFVINFADSSDRKIFIRLLSELPYLNLSLLRQLKSICYDPTRRTLGTHSLLYLVMFKPPLFNECIELYIEMLNEKGNVDELLQKECIKQLTKYAKDRIPAEFIPTSATVVSQIPVKAD
ncbi:unnamed protein product [Ambrosiozyma monospora]|uniref:Unnamed protein product n=1 Tax=Ambrosiozyma monospora TaxID=43982 RepID=A0A9W7DL50_AMBMO|nr:unnamed protein product [Ambrosiozyma monospora]